MPQDNQWQVVSETPAAPAPSTQGDTSWQIASETPALSSDHWFHGSDSPEAIAAAKAANPPMQQLEQAGIGAGRGALETVSTVAKGLNKIPLVGEYLAPKAGIQALDQATKTQNENEAGGKMVESIGELMLGDESLKAIPFVKRLEMIAKAGKLAEEHPFLAKILHAGISAVHQGSVATGVGLLHGEDLPTAAKQGASVGALGGTLEGVSSLAPDAIAGVKNAAKRLSSNSIQPTLQQGIRDAVSKVAQGVSDTDTFHQALSELGNGKQFQDLPVQQQSAVMQRAQALKAANGSSSVALQAKPTASIRDVVEGAADQVYGRSKALYAQLDQATGGQFQRFDDELQNINRKLRETAGLDDEKEAELLKKKADVEAAQQQVFDDAKAKGVDPQLVEQAKANYRRAQALYDLDLNVKKSVSGMRPDVGYAKQAAKNPETVDPKKLFGRINNLYDSGRLQEALGEQGADDLLAHVNENLVRHKVILRNQAVAKIVGKGAGYAVAGAAGGKAVSHLIQ